MCGRFTLTSSEDQIRDLFGVFNIPKPSRKYNIAPTHDVLIVHAQNTQPVASLAKWGLSPAWSRQQQCLINARVETILEKPSFRDAFRKRRCLIPATGFYEWKNMGYKQPFLFTTDSELFAFAGIYEWWKGEENEVLTCSILTTSPNDLVYSIHDRMPVILSKPFFEQWLGNETSPEELIPLLTAYDSKKMTAIPVNPRVNGTDFESDLCHKQSEVQGDLF